MNTTNNNALLSVTKTLAPTGTKKPSVKKGINTVVTLGKENARALMLEYVDGHILADTGIKACNIVIKKLIDSKVVFVKLSAKSEKETDAFKFTEMCKEELFKAFLAQSKYSKGTLENYWKAFSNAVNNKKLLAGLNVFRNKKIGKTKTEKTSEELKKESIKALGVVFRLSGSCDALEYMQQKIDDGMTLAESIEDYLKSEGIETSEE